MPAYHVQRSIVIKSPAERVFDTVADFGTWTTWSPWLGVDKDAEVTVTDDPRSVGSVYRWRGDLVGEGEIEHLRLDRPTCIDEQLRFLKPFKSTCGVGFDLESDGETTRIGWKMQGKLPWFMFWMRASMVNQIGMDYERGLKMLAEFIETGEVLSKIEVIGIESVEPRSVFGVRDSCSMDDVGPTMEKAFVAAIGKLSDNGIPTDGEAVSVYHSCDLSQRRFEFTSGLATQAGGEPPAGLSVCRLPAGKSLHVRHTGSYQNLGNAWSGAQQYARYKKLRVARRDAYEIYRNDPNQTPAAELVTDIYLPLK